MSREAQTRWCEVVPSAESHELHRLALIVRSIRQIHLNDPVARQELAQLFSVLRSIQHSAERLRELALDQLVLALGERPLAFADLHDLAVVAGVAPSHVEGVIARGEAISSSRPAGAGGDAGD